MKYKKRTDNFFTDLEYYVSKEGLYCVYAYGHKGNKRKVKYICDSLLKQYRKKG